MKRARKLGSNVFEAASKPVEERTYLGDQGVCPVCHQNLFSVRDGVLECALCQAKTKIKIVKEKIKLVFDPESLKNHRWSEEALLEHFSLAVLPSAPRFLKERDEIMRRARKYRSFPYEATKKARV
jgi:uncharacterized Zn finger protein (UPF0148 family)